MTQPLWTSDEAAAATGGSTAGDWSAHSVSIDSRTITPGGLYVAIAGERVDGHDYAEQAIDKGAAAVMVSQAVPGVAAEKQLLVDDTFKALEALAIAARARSQATIIGLTGSVGKTTTKECLRLMCEGFGRTYASRGNYNNHYGTPLSLANMPADSEFGVFEMGMNHAGEIAKLTRMVRPHIAIITNVEAVHLEFFDSVEAIAEAKAEIFEGLERSGTAILNADNEHTNQIIEQLSSRADVKQLTFGQQQSADIKLEALEYEQEGCTLSTHSKNIPVEVSLTGSGQAVISAVLISLTACTALGLDLVTAANSLAGFKEVEGRGQLSEVTLDGRHMWWIDDSYNASPASMRAAFEKLAMAKEQKQATRSVAVLGDMLELGEQAPKLHASLAVDIAMYGLDAVWTIGPLMQHLYRALPEDIDKTHIDGLDEMLAWLKDRLQAGDVVLFKGSNGSQIHQLVKDLLTP